MSYVNYLVPGYTQQAFSWGRSAFFDYEREFLYKNRLSDGANLGVKFITIHVSMVSEFVELPFKIIEDIAFSIINLIGSLFKEECQRHLKECGWQLLGDLGYALFPALITAQIALIIFLSSQGAGPILCSLTATFLFLVDFSMITPLTTLAELNTNMGDYHRIYWWRVEAIRQCGYEKVEKLEKGGLYPESKIENIFENIYWYFYNRLNNPTYAIKIYEALIKLSKQSSTSP